MSAEDYKIQGNNAVAERKWITAENLYSTGIECLSIPKDYDAIKEKDKLATHVLLLSNRSFTRVHIGK